MECLSMREATMPREESWVIRFTLCIFCCVFTHPYCVFTHTSLDQLCVLCIVYCGGALEDTQESGVNSGKQAVWAWLCIVYCVLCINGQPRSGDSCVLCIVYPYCVLDGSETWHGLRIVYCISVLCIGGSWEGLRTVYCVSVLCIGWV